MDPVVEGRAKIKLDYLLDADRADDVFSLKISVFRAVCV